ncbi:hypothetical protein IOK49_04210 [Fervidicoccus fontis]|uniref:ATPase n=1 Tax=Fervidicoccus fontis TaxID=683846 RepID=A0A843A9A8_9CREN|nr:hypothetical protein [Fervidicoccus fontis]MBE9391275.1 hypothetical protein [Fervidicoccus fontis]
MKKILIAGLLPYDSGKTTFSISLILHLRDMGIKAHPFKPVSSHNIFTQSSSFSESINMKLLAGGDALQYKRAFDFDIDMLKATNPLDLLLSPTDSSIYLKNSRLPSYYEDQENLFKLVSLMRITECKTMSAKHYFIRDNTDLFPPSFRKNIEHLSSITEALPISLDEALKILRSRELEDNFDICLERIGKGFNTIIVESFSDSLFPYFSSLKDSSMIIVVSPGRAFAYFDEEKMKKIKELKGIPKGSPRTMYLISRYEPDLDEALDLKDPLSSSSKLLSEISKRIDGN